MAAFDELVADLLPGARSLSTASPERPAPERLAPEVSWVRVMRARVPAFDALEPGDLAIVPASALAIVAPTADEVDELVDALVRAGAAGIVVLDGDDAASDEPLRLLEAALEGSGVTAVRARGGDAAALERSVIGYLVNRRAELDRQAAALEARLEGLAIEGASPADLVAAIAGFLGRAIALEGTGGAALAVHAPDVPGAAAAVAAYHRDGRAVALRVPLPAAGGRVGRLALLGERPPNELERVVVERIAGLLALEMSRDEALRRARDAARRTEAPPADGPPWVVLVARQRTGRPDDTPAAREALRREIRLLAPASRLALRGDADSLELRAVLAAPGEDPTGAGLAGRVAAFLGRTVAVSRPFGAPGERAAAEAEARATLEAAELLAEPPPVARAARLPAYRLLGALHNLPDGERHARALLEPLLLGRADVRREHLATLRAILDHSGPAEAAAALGVHRNTIAYRIRRIEALTGWSPTDPELRLPLAIAVRLVQDAQG